MRQQIFENCLFLLQDGYDESLDHPIYKKAHKATPAIQSLCAQIMADSTSEFQAVKYLQYLLEDRPIENGFRTKILDSLVNYI